jgi:hypothetical protein
MPARVVTLARCAGNAALDHRREHVGKPADLPVSPFDASAVAAVA